MGPPLLLAMIQGLPSSLKAGKETRKQKQRWNLWEMAKALVVILYMHNQEYGSLLCYDPSLPSPLLCSALVYLGVASQSKQKFSVYTMISSVRLMHIAAVMLPSWGNSKRARQQSGEKLQPIWKFANSELLLEKRRKIGVLNNLIISMSGLSSSIMSYVMITVSFEWSQALLGVFCIVDYKDVGPVKVTLSLNEA
ncbi:hypothetical protein AXG93_3943s1030 [Marchantia polymorpha subsp. ruderalis]|uniref:Uncharacterized protein n=1 Tax=Marchantia polymorpha subsp. ruderalis TaxID=1480154 RepID=A0A176WEU7_MARPO|nr:hypothetical protein AXG93_3943s1030 [Marchantia polymorpha subsp. ruderalis]